MRKLPHPSGKETIKALKKIGFKIVNQTGSHVKLQKNNVGQIQTVIIPLHKEIKPGTLRNGILKPINLSVEEFSKLL